MTTHKLITPVLLSFSLATLGQAKLQPVKLELRRSDSSYQL